MNLNIIRIDKFNHKCNSCDTKIFIEEVTSKCPICGNILYEKMTPVSFISLFKECLNNLQIDSETVSSFINNRRGTVSSMKICTELSQYYIDRPFEDKFGGQYKSFLIHETFTEILENNFNKD